MANVLVLAYFRKVAFEHTPTGPSSVLALPRSRLRPSFFSGGQPQSHYCAPRSLANPQSFRLKLRINPPSSNGLVRASCGLRGSGPTMVSGALSLDDAAGFRQPHGASPCASGRSNAVHRIKQGSAPPLWRHLDRPERASTVRGLRFRCALRWRRRQHDRAKGCSHVQNGSERTRWKCSAATSSASFSK